MARRPEVEFPLNQSVVKPAGASDLDGLIASLSMPQRAFLIGVGELGVDNMKARPGTLRVLVAQGLIDNSRHPGVLTALGRRIVAILDPTFSAAQHGPVNRAKRRIDNRGYKFYVVNAYKIESGWEYREDANDARKDGPTPALRHVYTRRYLVSAGIDPANNDSWVTQADRNRDARGPVNALHLNNGSHLQHALDVDLVRNGPTNAARVKPAGYPGAVRPVTVVVFRQFKPADGGDLIALFPQERADNRGNIMSYQHIGQHGAADPGITRTTLPAPEGKALDALRAELRGIGYVLDEKKRITR